MKKYLLFLAVLICSSKLAHAQITCQNILGNTECRKPSGELVLRSINNSPVLNTINNNQNRQPVQPVIYDLQIPDPHESFMQGVNRAKEQQREQSKQEDLDALIANPNPTARDYQNLIIKYPELTSTLEAAWRIRQQQNQ